MSVNVAADPVTPSRLRVRDAFAVGAIGLRSRRLRAALSALGIAIGIASLVAVVGISASSRADLIAQLDDLGTNLLTITPGQSFLGDAAVLPEQAPDSVLNRKADNCVRDQHQQQGHEKTLQGEPQRNVRHRIEYLPHLSPPLNRSRDCACDCNTRATYRLRYRRHGPGIIARPAACLTAMHA